MLPRSSVAGVAWPALPDARTQSLLALLWQLEQSQWWPLAELQQQQRPQLAAILAHAATTVPHYQRTLAGLALEAVAPALAGQGAGQVDAAGLAAWQRVPILTRAQLIDAGATMTTRRYPVAHGDVHETTSSRSTGEPVRIKVTGVVQAFWEALTLRDHAWHRRDLTARLGAIRYLGPGAGNAPASEGSQGAGWGTATAGFAPEAPVSVLSLATTTDEQVAWLLREDPAYLLVYPTVLAAMLRAMAASAASGGARPRNLRQVRTVCEALTPELRELCREVLGAPLVDCYSAQEVGYLALQCPDHPHYHVQAERLLVEILDEEGQPCRAGQVGRVVVTDLHNFATPLIRYELGDYAEVGEPCGCGRGLPVLRRIVGRRRGMLVYPDGRTAWPMFAVACREAAPYRELQVVQEANGALRARVVPLPSRPLEAGHRSALAAALRGAFDHPFEVTIEEVAQLDRSPAGKLEEFVSKVER